VVVVGVDDTLTAGRAICYATGLAARSRSLLVVVHAQPVPVPVWSGFGLWCAAPVQTKDECRVLREAETTVGASYEYDRVDAELRVGDPVRALCEVAEDRHADVIVVGSSRALRHRLWGSVPARLAAHGRWPVVVVP
jgi:nucleotide-binding universal stress UspA family protein